MYDFLYTTILDIEITIYSLDRSQTFFMLIFRGAPPLATS